MTKNTDQKEDSKFRTIKNDGFGASKARKLDVGDLVEWDSWKEDLSEDIFEVKTGLLLAIEKDRRLSGWAYIAKISEFGTGNEVIIPLISVRKMKNTD